MSISIGVQNERDHALCDVQNIVNEYGAPLVLTVRNETNVTRGKYGGIQKRATTTTHNLKSYPVQFSPTQQQLEKAGLREETTAVLYLAMKDITDLGYTYRTIDINRSTIVMYDERYEIREKSRSSQFADTFLYVTLGIYKR